jgi:hypothetical protein
MKGKNMRSLCAVLSLLFLAGCAATTAWHNPTSEGQLVESVILWDAQLDERWLSPKLEALLGDTTRFEPQGNFYKVKDDLVIFGHKATYVGMVGVEYYAGPNATLIGSPKSVARYITTHHDLDFEKQGGMYICDYREHIKIMAGKHPNEKDKTILIGCYTGP